MKNDILIDLNTLSEIYEIELQPIPNQEFTTTINNEQYKIELKTFLNEKTYITILKNEKCICNCANIKVGIDYAFLSADSELNNLVIFFGLNTNIADFNYKNFNKDLRLYFGII